MNHIKNVALDACTDPRGEHDNTIYHLDSPESDLLDLGPSDEDEHDVFVQPFAAHNHPDASRSRSDLTRTASRRLSRTDANSIVGGDSVSVLNEGLSAQNALDRHPKSDPSKTTGEQEVKATGIDLDEYDHTDKNRVFSFSLPFGGLSGVGSTLYRQLLSFKLDNLHLPMLGNSQAEDLAESRDIMRNKLSRQESIGTLEDAKYFSNVKSLEGLRFKAVKQSISQNLNEMLPDFSFGKREYDDPESVFNEIEGNIVIMGGYRGSVLRDTKTNKRVWIPLKAGLKLRKINLLLGPSPEDEVHATDLIYPDGMLKNIGPIDISKRLIRKLSNNPKTNVKEFGYDWRLSGGLVAKQLHDYLQRLYDETGKPTLVIAHSMGGFIVHGAMHINPALLRGVIYVGAPSECLNMLGPIRFGDSVMFSDKILRAETNFMMRSSFLFLPLLGRVFVNKETKEHYDLDFFDPQVWVDYNLNPLVAQSRKIREESARSSGHHDHKLLSAAKMSLSNSLRALAHTKLDFNRIHRSISQSDGKPIENDVKDDDGSTDDAYEISFSQAYEYLARTLRETKEYILSLNYRPEMASEYPPMAIVYGNEVPSVRGSLVHSRQDIRNGDYYEFYYGHGDGVVHQKWLMPERKGFMPYDPELDEGEIVGKFPSPCGHIGLLTDIKAMLSALKAIMDAEKVWKRKQQRQRANRREIASQENDANAKSQIES